MRKKRFEFPVRAWAKAQYIKIDWGTDSLCDKQDYACSTGCTALEKASPTAFNGEVKLILERIDRKDCASEFAAQPCYKNSALHPPSRPKARNTEGNLNFGAWFSRTQNKKTFKLTRSLENLILPVNMKYNKYHSTNFKIY